MRKIIHIDQDCFYAAVEMRADPSLRKVPLAVGGTDRRSVICTSNYLARSLGVKSAMPVFMALKQCPNLVVVPPRFDLYQAVSTDIRAIFQRYTDQIEPLSLDEAYLDVTDHPADGVTIATRIRQAIRRELRLPCSAGISLNKLLAKIASDWNKPNGQFEIKQQAVAEFMQSLPVRRLWGIGPKAEQRLVNVGIRTCGQLQKLPLATLIRQFGSMGGDIHSMCRGIDNRPVESGRNRKSVSCETTLGEPIDDPILLDAILLDLFRRLTDDLNNRRTTGIFVKLKNSAFELTTVARRDLAPSPDNFRSLLMTAWQRSQPPFRLVGIGARLDIQPGLQMTLPL